MAETNSVARSLHDLGLAAWFGGSLMGAVGLNSASGKVSNNTDRLRVANAGWGAWTPVQIAAIAAHLVGGAQILQANKGRVAAQQGVGSATVAKTVVTAAALGATAYSGLLGGKLMKAEAEAQGTSSEGVEVTSGVDPAPQTPPDVASKQRQLKIVQWVLPLLTGIMLVLNARLGEQQRPSEVSGGLLGRFTSGD